MNILVIAPHHDDEVIGCGGSIARHAARGDVVSVVYATAGWSGMPDIADRSEAVKQRRAESSEACRMLGISRTVELELPDRHFGFSGETVERMIHIFRAIGPAIVYVPHRNDGDHEHMLVHQMVMQALWQAASQYFPELGVPILPPRTILGYEVWRPLSSYQTAVDISSVLEQKLNALRCYRSQIAGRDWISATAGLAAFRGITSGVGNYAEVFEVIRCESLFAQST